MMTPDFSIITCTLNSAHWIKQSIRSVLRQNSVSIDYIFVDGGSTDGTLKKIQSITSPYKLLQRPAAGISDAMNAGIAEATGKIIACLHSDDFYLHANVLATVAERFNTTGCQWLFGRTSTLIDGKLKPENFKAPAYTHQALLKGNFIPHPATFVTHELMQKSGGFNTELRYAMDYDLWLRLSLMANPVQLNFPLTAFREHQGSLSTANRMAALREDLQVRLKYAPQDPLARILHLARFQIRKFRQHFQTNQKYVKHA
jgi:glycosyltransferase involved in cell wall biosynthesis